MSSAGIKASFAVERPLGIALKEAVATADGALYDVHYRYELRGSQWWAVLDRMVETMPAATPEIRTYDDTARLHMMDEHGRLDFVAEANQRRKEWDAHNRAAMAHV